MTMIDLLPKATPLSRDECQGMTLIEVVIATALALLLSVGLLAVGLRIQRLGEYSRCATEARALAKERLEGIISMSLDNLRSGSMTMLQSDTNSSLRGYPILLQTRLVWHAGNGSVWTNPLNAAYAEVHTDIIFWSALNEKNMTNTYSMIIDE
jgi:prepilin-type N-terminal cleavage/methylation domain-containing protein